MVPVPRDEPGPLVTEIHPTETVLSGSEERPAHRVIVRPHEQIIDADVLKLNRVPVRTEDLRVTARRDHQVRVWSALGLVQRVHEGAFLLRVQLHHVPSD